MKNVIITGTSRGIGFELVKLFAKKGMNVLAISRNSTPIAKLNLPNVTSLSIDLSDEKKLQKAVNFVKDQWKQVDILIHNAGKLINKPFSKLTTSDFSNIYQVNVFAVAELTRLLLPFLTAHSHVVTISSMGGIQGSVKFPGLAAYSSSKGAVLTLTELLAEEYKEKKICFNALALGAVQTEMLEEAFPEYKAPIKPNEIATYIYDFSCNGHRYYNGKILQVSSTTP